MNWADNWGDWGRQTLRRLSIDSRQHFPEGDALFVALETPSGDGHLHLQQAFENGCPAALVHRMPAEVPEGMRLFRVSNTLETLQAWAAEARGSWTHPVVALVGSNGKTIVKEWAAELLATSLRAVRSPRSYNSQVGVPLSLLTLSPEADAALVEMGISESGEMAGLVRMVRPTGVVFTSFGSAHALGFASEEAKLAEKMQAAAGTEFAVWCADHEPLRRAFASYAGDRWDWTVHPERHADAAFSVGTRRVLGGTEVSIRGKNQELKAFLPFEDDVLVEDAIHAALLALRLGADAALLSAGLAQLTPLGMRLETLPALGGGVIINDSYATDAESLRLAWDALNRQPAHWERRVVLGPMEQSKLQPDAFRALVAEYCRASGVVELWGVGSWVDPADPVWRAAGWAGAVRAFAQPEELVHALERLPQPVWPQSAVLIKGPRSQRLERLVPLLQAQQHATVLEVDLNALAANLKGYRAHLKPGTKVMAMVKASAYGLGATEIARTLSDHRIDYLGVAYVDEGLQLRQAGITTPIMVLNPGETAYSPAVAYGLEPEIYDLDSLRRYGRAVQAASGAPSARIHIKFDTGMHRLGFSPDEVPQLLEELARWPEVVVASALTHLASADKPDQDDFTRRQLASFQAAADALARGLGYPVWRHALNSAGAARFPEAAGDLVRLGLGLYGYSSVPSERSWLRPVAGLFSVVSQVRTVPTGDSVSYGGTWVAPEPREIATIPVGYADGFARSLSNGVGHVCIRGRRVPVVGVVCMDMFMVDVTGLGCQKGDRVEWFGPTQTLYEVASEMQTIPYEVLTGLSPRIKRLYVRADH